MIPATWWSESKKSYVPVSEMHGFHILAAMKKLDRGDYRPGGEPQADRLPPEDEAALLAAMDAECQKRSIGRYEVVEPQEEGFA